MSNRTISSPSGAPKKARKWSPTELLILALISRGHATTLYALQKETQLSAGALVPALAKLKAEGLIHAAPVGPRKKIERRTEQKEIEENWKAWKASALDLDHIADCDAVLKLCRAAEIFDPYYAMDYAHAAAELRAAELRKYRSRAGRLEAPEVDPLSYRSYRDVAHFYRLQAEEKTLRAVEAALRTDL